MRQKNINTFEYIFYGKNSVANVFCGVSFVAITMLGANFYLILIRLDVAYNRCPPSSLAKQQPAVVLQPPSPILGMMNGCVGIGAFVGI
jgi:hypothetical protein